MTNHIELNPGCERLEPNPKIRRLVPKRLMVESYRDETGSVRHVFIRMSHVDICTDDIAGLSDELLEERYLRPALDMLERHAGLGK